MKESLRKTLQELTAQRGLASPDYDVSSTGPDHDKSFTARVLVGGELVGEGTGRSKKAAEQAAAGDAFARLTIDPG